MRAAAALLLLPLMALPAAAADGASLGLIGYSPDSRYFSFEQYGVQDGSGFPYWDVFVLDLKTNQWLPGTPVHAQIDSEDGRVADARAKARAAAQPVLDANRITEPAELLADNPATEIVPDRSKLTFDRWYVSGGSQVDGKGSNQIRFELALSPIQLPNSAECPLDYGENYGLRLTIKDITAGTTRTIYEDKTIPASRDCPTSYDLSAVVAQSGYPVTDRLVAIIGVYGRGFEGSDHRFIAVPFSVSD